MTNYKEEEPLPYYRVFELSGLIKIYTMKNKIGVTFISVVLMLSVFTSCQIQQPQQHLKEMTITTSSKKALKLFLKGRKDFDLARNHSAIEFFDKAIALDSNFAMAYEYRSWLGTDDLSRKNARKKAYALIDKVSEGERLWILFNRAWANNDLEKIIKHLDSFLALYPDDKRGNYYAGVVNSYLIKDQEKALWHYNKALESDKDFLMVYVAKKNVEIKLERFSEAEKSIQNLIRLQPNQAIPYFSYGQLLTKLGRFDESIEQHEIALKKDAEFDQCYCEIGHNYILKGKYQKAREYYWKTVNQKCSERDILTPVFYEAISYLFEGNLDEFTNSYRKFGAIAKKNKLWNNYINAFAEPGIVFTQLNNPVEAKKYFDKAIELIETLPLCEETKKDYSARSDRWRFSLFIAQKDLRKAEEILKKIDSDLSSEGQYAYDLHANYEMASGNHEEAIELFNKIDNLWPVMMYDLAVCYEKVGDKEKALEYYLKIKNFNEIRWTYAAVWQNILNKVEVLQAEIQGSKNEVS